ncbi:hypothetical protein GGTG_06903 [Gaeumannomyces tritici R3-111a-1]|uniref:Uncharacterized protein n=1 Tax=Gaeumannomyces tritici (strain R3-111a-1) TaxID=644352 RepID=J3P056_GAET3|nr:hypothetical protein GGTG_06903 [Gaeumannomyces tritici R3-111a-1]EJT76989.1 hypothetical protein GGTG_06903 [Gaeumannomyces tritici R3-111a-1]
MISLEESSEKLTASPIRTTTASPGLPYLRPAPCWKSVAGLERSWGRAWSMSKRGPRAGRDVQGT